MEGKIIESGSAMLEAGKNKFDTFKFYPAAKIREEKNIVIDSNGKSYKITMLSSVEGRQYFGVANEEGLLIKVDVDFLFDAMDKAFKEKVK